jgi:hypothetical protein
MYLGYLIKVSTVTKKKKLMKIRLFVLFTAVSLAISFSSCRRHKDDVDAENGTVYVAQGADESATSGESDNVIADVTNALATADAPGGGRAAAINVCGATVTTSGNVVTLTFNGTSPCSGRVRYGVITFELIAGNKWRDANSVVKVDFKNYKINKYWNGENRNLTLNGVHYIKNVSGGLVSELTPVSSNTIVHRVTGNMSLTFDSGATRNWKLARLRTFSSSGSDLRLTVAGDTTVAGVSNVDVVGTNRFGNAFQTVISTPIQMNSSCGWAKPTAGVKNHTGAFGKDVSVTFGTDSNGNIATGTSCPDYYKIAYTLRNGNTYTAVKAY